MTRESFISTADDQSNADSIADHRRHHRVIREEAATRILLAKVGLDGHDRGIKVVARGLRDAGFHVIYSGIWQSPAAVARAVVDEDVDWLGLSLLSGAHRTLVPRVMQALQDAGRGDVPCLVGGIIPDRDIDQLQRWGVTGVFGSGSTIGSFVELLRQPQYKRPEVDVASLLASVRNGQRQALGVLLSWVVRHGKPSLDEPVQSQRGRGQAIAITGSPGVGKSTLIAGMIHLLRGRGKTVAVLACDPQSPISGGALLGDRLRMANSLDDDGVLMRSLAATSGSQGIVPHLPVMIELLQRFGFDHVLLESVGVGQGDVAIADVVDQLVLLVQPETGDSVQWEKAGLMEVADMIVLQKSDLPGAKRLEQELTESLRMRTQRTIPLFCNSMQESTGLNELISILVGPGRSRGHGSRD